jgi:hypothetical protein
MKKVYKKKDKEYQEWYKNFIERFNKVLGPYLPSNFDSAKVFRKKIKKIKVKTKKNDKDYFPKSRYDPWTRAIEINYDIHSNSHVKIHETMHGMSTVEKRRRIFLDIHKLIFRKYNDFMLEEGLTEYLTKLFEGNSRFVNVFDSPYTNEAILSSLLFKIIDPKIIMAFYFKNDKRFIDEINKVFPGGYYELLKIYRDCTFPQNLQFSEPSYSKKDNMINTNVMFETFKKVKMLPPDSLENFKKNVDLIIYFYKGDFYSIAHKIFENEAKLKRSAGEEIAISQRRLDCDKDRLKKNFRNFINTVLRPEWEKLGNNDEHLFEEILTQAIKGRLAPNTFDLISEQGILNLTEQEEQTSKSN